MQTRTMRMFDFYLTDRCCRAPWESPGQTFAQLVHMAQKELTWTAEEVVLSKNATLFRFVSVLKTTFPLFFPFHKHALICFCHSHEIFVKYTQVFLVVMWQNVPGVWILYQDIVLYSSGKMTHQTIEVCQKIYLHGNDN